MERETIVYKGEKYHRYPKHKQRPQQVYYIAHTSRKLGPKRLHREIYKDNHGPIPRGMVVHHKDGNPLNNSINNLVLETLSDHQSHHASEPKRVERARETIKIARISASKWHKSPTGLAWHKRQALKRFG